VYVHLPRSYVECAYGLLVWNPNDESQTCTKTALLQYQGHNLKTHPQQHTQFLMLLLRPNIRYSTFALISYQRCISVHSHNVVINMHMATGWLVYQNGCSGTLLDVILLVHPWQSMSLSLRTEHFLTRLACNGLQWISTWHHSSYSGRLRYGSLSNKNDPSQPKHASSGSCSRS